MTRNRAKKRLNNVRRLSLRSVVLSLIVIVSFIVIVSIYYGMLYSAKKESMVKDCEVTAKQSAERIGNYLSTNIDMLKLAAYTLDEMIRACRSDEDIQAFLVDQSTAIKNSVFENSTGLYGYINGRFFSGTNWIPPADYNAKERPWYTRPFDAPGEITLLDPYVDVQSGNTMLALGKLLSDGKSVLSVDVSLARIQKLTEEAVTDSYSDLEMVINDKGVVIAHSDATKIGKNYFEESVQWGQDLEKELRENSDGYLELKVERKEYIVYFVGIQNGWRCISLKDVTEVFVALRRIFILTVSIFVLLIVLSAYIVTRMSKLRNISESAKAANDAKSNFLSKMSHEIRTPINAVLGMNEMILRESGDENIISYAQGIKTAGDSLLGLVNDILDFSKIEAGKMEIIPVEYDVSSLINDLVNMVRLRADKKGLALELWFDPHMPRILRGDVIRIKQVISNILTNAVKYTEKGCVTFKIGFEKPEEDPNSVILKVSVEDTGMGIRPEDMNKLFTEFDRIDEERNRNIEGTGLGLNIAQGLLVKMGSSLQVGSVFGKGSIFGFNLKQEVVKWDELGDYESAYKKMMGNRKAYREKFTAPDARVLVIDDNPMNLVVFKGLLKRTGIGIDTANDGNEGLALSRKHKYDIIFFDHMMPVKDGIETLSELREEADNPNLLTHAVCLTANAVSGAREFYLSNGFDDYLTKPVDADRLEEMLMELLPAEKVMKSDGSEEDDTEDDSDAAEKLMEKLKGIDYIDAAAGIKNCGSADTYAGLLKMFYGSIDDKIEELQEYLDKNDLKDYTIKVHALKSSARAIGAAAFGEEAQKLENAGKSGDTAYINENHELFIKEYRHFEGDLAPLFESKESIADSNKPLIGKTMIRKVYEDIRHAAEEMDCDAFDAVFDRIKGYRIPDEETEVFTKVRSAAEVFDYETVTALIDSRENAQEEI